jgi:ankyrin repeat protein
MRYGSLFLHEAAADSERRIGPSVLEQVAEMGLIYNSGIFLDWGSPINQYGLNGKSCLQAAAGHGRLPLTQYLIGRGADVNLPASNDEGLTALQAAALGGYSHIVEYLIDTAGADVRAAPAKNGGHTALEAAAGARPPVEDYENHDEDQEERLMSTFKSILAYGAPVNRTDGLGTVLHRLVRSSRIEGVRLALQAGAQVEDRDRSCGMKTALQVAAEESNMEAIRLLLDNGDNSADINALAGDEFGRTALQAATSAHIPSLNVVKFLILHKAQVNAPPAKKGGVTALQGAAISGSLPVAKLLLMHGADVNAAPSAEEGRTAMEGAAEHGRLDMVRLLLIAGAVGDPVLGFSRAIELAEENGHLVVAELLRKQDSVDFEFLLTGVQ